MPVYKLQNRDYQYKHNRVANKTLFDFPQTNEKMEEQKLTDKENEWLDNCLCLEKYVKMCDKCTQLLTLDKEYNKKLKTVEIPKDTNKTEFTEDELKEDCDCIGSGINCELCLRKNAYIDKLNIYRNCNHCKEEYQTDYNEKETKPEKYLYCFGCRYHKDSSLPDRLKF